MMSGISGMSGMGGMRPSHQEMFRRDDADGSGGIDTEELTALTDKIAERSGTTIDAEGLMSEFDADEDGVLNEAEAHSAMGSINEQMGPPPGGPPPMGGPMGQGGPPPQNASALYSQNSSDNPSALSALLKDLSESETDEEDAGGITQQWLDVLQGKDETYSPVDAMV